MCVFVSTSCWSADEGRLGKIEGSSVGCTSKKDNLLASGRLKNDLFEGEKWLFQLAVQRHLPANYSGWANLGSWKCSKLNRYLHEWNQIVNPWPTCWTDLRCEVSSVWWTIRLVWPGFRCQNQNPPPSRIPHHRTGYRDEWKWKIRRKLLRGSKCLLQMRHTSWDQTTARARGMVYSW